MNKYINTIKQCHKIISNDIINTPLNFNKNLSEHYKSNIYFKREDLQITRSFKLRGSLNKIKSIDKSILHNSNGVICASAGNHAQGFAYSCNKLNIYGDIFVPKKTPLQKINRIKYYGKDNIKIHLHGINFDESLNEAQKKGIKENKIFVHPFDDHDIINGQATIAYEIFNESLKNNLEPDIIICSVGGGGLISGVSKYAKTMNSNITVIGVEPIGAASLYNALLENKPIQLDNIDTFVDGASVAKIGDKTFEYCRKYVDKLYQISNEELSHNIITVYENDGIILEPAGALSISVLKHLHNDSSINIENKNIVCILSGGNNDITRYDEIMEMNLKYLDLKHYFIINFGQRPGELKMFINNILGVNDDIIRFEYIKKTNKNYGTVLIGIELINKDNIHNIIENLNKYEFTYKKIDINEIYS